MENKFGDEFASQELIGKNAWNAQIPNNGGKFWPSSDCRANQGVQETVVQKDFSVIKPPGTTIPLMEWATYFKIFLRNKINHPSELGIQIISDLLSENSKFPFQHSAPELVIYTAKDDAEQHISRMTLSQTPCPQGIIWNKDLAISDGNYTEGEHFKFLHNERLSGSFGSGVKCEDLKTHKKFFMKQIKRTKFRKSEVRIPIHLDHENVTKLYGVIQRDDMVEILMEDAGVSLSTFVTMTPKLEERIVLEITKQSLAGLKELHQKDVVHHDIKPDNLCICTKPNGSYMLKLTDFGSARFVTQPIDSMAWTPAYLAPEACRVLVRPTYIKRNEEITGKVDVFSLGLVILFVFKKEHVLLQMTHGRVSYKDLSHEEKQNLNKDLLQCLADWCELPQDLIPKECSEDMKYLLHKMLSGSPDQRLSAADCLAFIELKRNEYKQTQNGRLVTHPSENHQDAGEMRVINFGAKKQTKDKLRMKILKKFKVLEAGTEALTVTGTVIQVPKMETNIETRSVASTTQDGTGNHWTELPHAIQVQVLNGKKPSAFNGISHINVAQNSVPQYQADTSDSRKPEKHKQQAELYQRSGKRMRKLETSELTPFIQAQPVPEISCLVGGLSKTNDSGMKPKMMDDIQHKDATKLIGNGSAMDVKGNLPHFSKLF